MSFQTSAAPLKKNLRNLQKLQKLTRLSLERQSCLRIITDYLRYIFKKTRQSNSRYKLTSYCDILTNLILSTPTRLQTLQLRYERTIITSSNKQQKTRKTFYYILLILFLPLNNQIRSSKLLRVIRTLQLVIIKLLSNTLRDQTLRLTRYLYTQKDL